MMLVMWPAISPGAKNHNMACLKTTYPIIILLWFYDTHNNPLK